MVKRWSSWAKPIPNVVALSADVSNSDFSFMFEEAFPDRFFNVGIAEQSLVDVAVGLAYSGKIPFANTFAFLFATRALEMVRTHLCYGRANVKLMALMPDFPIPSTAPPTIPSPTSPSCAACPT